ncbi:Nucleolar protein 14 [Heterocephalus glaber]|uniref:Nucleolar protein 14 n=1 Tax=Heterocephalus glaber TaxID=10181 RepID=G5BCG9_HETGA|nr:Nucleolar protein 14 [Heterocephalus glaber]
MGKARPAGARRPAPKTPVKANPNPFEVKVNRQKFQILGRKTRHDVGLPGVSRARAIRKRTQTLLKEYKDRDKSNVFKDKRFGEYNSDISPEEKMLKRFALEQQRHHEKKSIYNLNEDEELTHYGQSLADIEKHHDIVDSDSDAEDRGALSAELTAAHFGGGARLLQKTAPQEEEDKPKSRKELIEELIAKSKQEKREKQAQREDALELTEKLDQDWKEIQTLLSHRTPKSENREKEKPKPDAYDVMVRELGFEMKAQPSNRMKTEEELAKEEQERLRKLEAERLRRMLGKDEDEKTKKPRHMSADDLNDGFILDRDDRRLLSYKDGKMNVEDIQEGRSREASSLEEEEEGEESDEEEEEGQEESEGPDSCSDLDSNEDSEEDLEKPEEEQCQAPGGGSLSHGQRAGRAAGSELPYTFAAPESCEELRLLLSGRSVEEQLLVVERIQKCNHPSLAVGNKSKLEKLFGFLLEYVGDLATSDPPDLKAIDRLVLQLYNLCQMFPESASSSMQFVLRDAMHEMEEMIETRGRAALPGLDVLIYLKIAGLLFPTSDFRHPVVTPALMCMSQILTKCPVLSLRDVVKGLFVCCLFLDYVSLSRRFIPELVNFLLGILYIAAPNKQSHGSMLVHPFRPHGKNSELLLLSSEDDVATWQRGSLPLHWASGPRALTTAEANHVRLSCLATGLALLRRCVLMYGALPSFHAIFRPLRGLLKEHQGARSHPPELQELAQSILTDIENQTQLCRPLICEKSKPVPLKLFTPRLVRVLEFGRKQGSTKEEQERKRLIHKHKREFKGAIREIRKDNQFLARMQLSEIMERDAERKRKVKQLFNSLATQEGEWKALKRKKFKK